MSKIVQDFQHYSAWRAQVVSALRSYKSWVGAKSLTDPATEQRIARALARLADDKLSVAFVAEFSRGKSELINAIFFADYGQRILPSAAGRTTMCPTELMYDPAYPPSIRLLPIETRAHRLSTGDYRDTPGAWTVIPLELGNGDAMQAAFKQVAKTKHVTVDEARSYGLYDENDPDAKDAVTSSGLVEVSLWRHAIINFPHPLLRQGLVILDTPGLNAIGTEPELTLNLIPNAHAVLFILAAETGVTKSDIQVWRNHIGAGPGRVVVLNKIDVMWDELKSEDENEAEIERQRDTVARVLALSKRQVYPVSAQKALVGKINGDLELLEKSRIRQLEAALFNEMIPAKKDIIRRQLADDMKVLTTAHASLLSARLRDVVEQLHELKSLRGKNKSVIQHMMRRVDAERKEFDASLYKLQGTRAVFARLSNELYSTLGVEVVQREIDAVREHMEQSRFATAMREAVRTFFDSLRNDLAASIYKVDEISQMMDTMYRKFNSEHGLQVSPPARVSLAHYSEDIDRIERAYQRQFTATAMLMTSRVVLMERFFDTVASSMRRVFRAANNDVDAWLKVVMAPLETQIRAHKQQLKQRVSQIQRIHDATDSLELRIESFEASLADLERLRDTLTALSQGVHGALNADPLPVSEAA